MLHPRRRSAREVRYGADMVMAGMFGALAGGKPHSKHLEISLDSPFAVFYGSIHEADPVDLTGNLVLTTTDHTSIRSIKIVLEGRWRVTWGELNFGHSHSSTTSTIRDKGSVIREELVIYPSATPGSAAQANATSATTHKIAPGTHSWPFRFRLAPTLPESVEGLTDGNFVVYGLSAEIDRGYMSKPLTATKHVRIVRTLSRDVTETVPLPYSTEETWVGKLRYHVYIPSRYFVYGTEIPVDFTLLPLGKGIEIGKIRMDVLETVYLNTGPDGKTPSHHTTLRENVVARTEKYLRDIRRNPLVDNSVGMSDDSYNFRLVLPLKRSLHSLRQTVETEHIKIRHSLKCYVNIHNPDGHVSQLTIKNLIHVYLSPDLVPAGDAGCIPVDLVREYEARERHRREECSAGDGFGLVDIPPTYGTHMLDQLYDEIDPTMYQPSGANTPFLAASRNQSLERLSDPQGASQGPGPHNRLSQANPYIRRDSLAHLNVPTAPAPCVSSSSSPSHLLAPHPHPSQLQDRLAQLESLTEDALLLRSASPVRAHLSLPPSGAITPHHASVASPSRAASPRPPSTSARSERSEQSEHSEHSAHSARTGGSGRSGRSSSNGSDASTNLTVPHPLDDPGSAGGWSDLLRVPSYDTAVHNGVPQIACHGVDGALEGLGGVPPPTYDSVLAERGASGGRRREGLLSPPLIPASGPLRLGMRVLERPGRRRGVDVV